MYTHDRPALSELGDLPEVGNLVFWEDDIQYTIRSEPPKWMVFGHFRPGKATPLVTLHKRPDGWETIQINGTTKNTADDWRSLLLRAI